MASNRFEKHLPYQRFALFFSLTLILASIAGGARSKVVAALNRGETIPVVLFGIDAADASRHTDTLMLAVFDAVNNNLSVLAIPRDTLIHLPGYRFRRVNEIYGYQFRKTRDWRASAELVVEGLWWLLSPEGGSIALPYFIQADYSGFEKVVDTLGGVWVRVREPMHYDDKAGDYHIHLEPGRYLMNGREALRYVRYRGPSGDRGRIFRQQEFIRSMMTRLANPMLMFRIPRCVATLGSSLRGNLSFWDAVYLAASIRRLRFGDVHFYMLPGRPKGAYWEMDGATAWPLAAGLLKGNPGIRTATPTVVPQAGRITINVWNASGRKGVAYEITGFLRSKGYDVVEWGNSSEQAMTRVVDRRGRIASAQSVAEDLGVASYHSEPNPAALVDVEVFIGRNYAGVGRPPS